MCTRLRARVCARKTIPIPHGTRERLIEMKPCERNILWGEFYGGPPRAMRPSHRFLSRLILCKSNHRLPLTITTFRESDWLPDWIVNERETFELYSLMSSGNVERVGFSFR